MEITSFSDDGFKIKGKEAQVAINPVKASDVAGSQIVIYSKSGKEQATLNFVKDVFVIENPGEFEVKGVRVYGYSLKDETIYLIQVDDINIAYTASLSDEMNKDLAEEFNLVNILLVSAADDPTDLISQLGPNVVVPMNYTEASLSKFLKEMGEENVERTSKLKVTSFGEESEETRVVVLI